MAQGEGFEYPSEQTLTRIREWPHTDFHGLIDYVESIWTYGEWGFRRRKNFYLLSTGGWSGNEDIIGALRANGIFWSICWRSSRRGGHYVFKI